MQAPACASVFAGRLECRVRRMMPRARPRWNAILCITNACGRRPALGAVAPANKATRSCRQITSQFCDWFDNDKKLLFCHAPTRGMSSQDATMVHSCCDGLRNAWCGLGKSMVCLNSSKLYVWEDFSYSAYGGPR